MIKETARQSIPDKETIREELDAAREKLEDFQIRVKEAKLPVIVIIEGWGAAGKGSVLGRIIRNIDPRFFRVVNMDQPTEEDKREPFLYRYFIQIPEAGKFRFFDTCYMEEVTEGVLSGEYDEKTYRSRIRSINTCERQLCDNGYLILKFFFQIGKKEQKKRLEELLADKNTAWRVDKDDLWENKHYDECLAVYDRYLEETNSPTAPWYIIDARDRKWAELQTLNYLNQGLETALRNTNVAAPIRQNPFRLLPAPKLAEIPLDKTISEEEYKEELPRLQKRLRELHYELYRKKIPVIIGYEGWDAAGKGGNIKRIAGALDPRGYVVEPIASPEPHEKGAPFPVALFHPAPEDRPYHHFRQNLVRARDG
jgi:polyphosphate kinase 2 (PPK2 family)